MARRRRRTATDRPTRRLGGWLVAAGALAAIYLGFRWTGDLWRDRSEPEVAPRGGLEEVGPAPSAVQRSAAWPATPEWSPGPGAPSSSALAPGIAARAPDEGAAARAAPKEELTEEDRRALEDVLDRTVKPPRNNR